MATKPITKIVDPSSIIQYLFDDATQVMRTAESGHDFKPIGALNAVTRIGAGVTIRCYNNTGAVHWVKFGTSAVTAPTNFADGLPVPANSFVDYNSGASEYIISDVATMFGYTASAD
jgi:hypothetical protein